MAPWPFVLKKKHMFFFCFYNTPVLTSTVCFTTREFLVNPSGCTWAQVYKLRLVLYYPLFSLQARGDERHFYVFSPPH